ncbi:MAG: electron transfer flavoprotein subunit beta [Symbiobacteriaceae bacterium]|jgi:electron transfer flavoprotein beta subunit|nr:electron transfer flavoprotein subunit beta [Symbiobacteriaceae bacterium]
MPNIITCYKWVVDEADIKVEGNGALNFERAGRKISEYDRNAIEASVQIVEANGGSVTAVSLGGPEVKNSAKDCLSRGPDRAILALDAAFADTDAVTTALGLVRAIGTAGAYDLVLCGEGSGDVYGQQVGPRVAELLGIPSITFVNKLTVTATGVVAERKLEDGVEVVEADFPVLVTVLPDLNKPRIPGLKQVMGAAKKPVTVLDAAALGLTEAELGARAEARGVKAPASNRKQVKAESVTALAEAIAAALR